MELTKCTRLAALLGDGKKPVLQNGTFAEYRARRLAIWRQRNSTEKFSPQWQTAELQYHAMTQALAKHGEV